ncbi:MAG: carbamoyl-phosphate synthase domain-containing protein, partial [Burkholderiales bacterium]
MQQQLIEGRLVLATGEIFTGMAPAWQQGITFGEVVFNTGMTGYEETLTDPSYIGQIITFTYPILGNYGVADNKSWESNKIHPQGVICQTIYDQPYHYAKIQTFLDWLKQHNTPILFAVDTRALTKILRKHGVISGALVFNQDTPTSFPDTMATHWVKQVSCKQPHSYGQGKYKIILVDCGTKQNILNNLLKFDVTVKVVPFDYDYTNEEYD